MARIDPTARVADAAKIGANVEIGPYCIIGPDVTIGDDCKLLAHVHVAGATAIGPRADDLSVRFARNAAAIGALQGRAEPALDRRRLRDPRVGDDEHRNRGRTHGNAGGRALHVHGLRACRARLHRRKRCTFANGGTLGGHCTVGDFVFMGGYAAVHQFVRIGERAVIGGLSGVVHDVIPFARHSASAPSSRD